MNTLQKPLRMADLPGKVYRCGDDNPTPEYKPKDPTSWSGKLRAMAVDDELVIPKTSAGLISRMARNYGIVFTTRTVDNGANLRVTRIK